jgi:hypothetical protein
MKVDKSSYTIKIERTMVDISDSDENEFEVLYAYYDSKGVKCDLCGHVPIKRVFKLRSKETGQILFIGCECAVNYLSVDLVQAFEDLLNKKINDYKAKQVLDQHKTKYLPMIKNLQKTYPLYYKDDQYLQKLLDRMKKQKKGLTPTMITNLERIYEKAKTEEFRASYDKRRDASVKEEGHRKEVEKAMKEVESRAKTVYLPFLKALDYKGGFVGAMIDKIEKGTRLTENMVNVIERMIRDHKDPTLVREEQVKKYKPFLKEITSKRKPKVGGFVDNMIRKLNDGEILSRGMTSVLDRMMDEEAKKAA